VNSVERVAEMLFIEMSTWMPFRKPQRRNLEKKHRDSKGRERVEGREVWARGRGGRAGRRGT